MSSSESTLTAVTVFPDRARVTRAIHLPLDPGAHTVTFGGLPLQLDEASVRAAGKGSARLTGVQVTRRTYAQAAPSAAKDALEQLQALLDQDKLLADEQDAWTQRLAVVKKIGEQGGENFARSVARGKLALDDLTGVLDYLSQSHEAAATILRDLTVRRRELQKQIEAAKSEADKLRSAAAREVYEARVNLDVNASGEIEIELSYTVFGAQWNALYDARLDKEKLEWNYLAQVRNQTGEDWSLPYALTLSTATLATGLDKPELPPWYVDAARPILPRMMQTRDGAPALTGAAPMAEMAMPTMALGAAPMPKMEHVQAEIGSSGGTSVTYKIATPRAIPSDGEPHQVAIAALNADARIDYFCAPKVDAHAFVRAKLTNPSEYVMLAGQVNLYHGADFVGTRHVETIVPNQEVEFFLGAEERIHVERQETKRAVDKNFLGNTARTNLAYRIHIENPALELVRLTVLDQIPVSAHPDIRVKLQRAAPDISPNEQGELEWTGRELKRGESADFEFEFTVEYPKEMRVVGL